MPSIFKFCPNCQSTHFTFENNIRFHCSTCDFTYYHNIAAAVAIVFTFEDKILFTVRNVDPDKGKLDLPGGFVDPNENAEEAACREINEELGLEIFPNNLRYITTSPNNYLYKNIPYKTMDIFYECSLSSDIISITAKDEIQELIWVNRSEIDLDSIGFVSIRKIIKEFYCV
ncbi:NUDIX domain-containing protein [Flavobacterium sediminilitoris]|uniref:NUDIX domain-containing protein n=1 Tax=Flavobacterium sediminilitoris TaxID=2024526 RepID=A0ABY4HJ92_9FLAO|nr:MULTISPECIES: NUDIX domain-containing protein [Flavobacterium]UOX32908.1 NUDIX domain-containing protein [Flavobacterium sediminilitoris]